MGSSRKQRPNNRPRGAQSDGNVSSRGGRGTRAAFQDLTADRQEVGAWLVCINPEVHAKTSVGVSIAVQQVGDGYQVLTAAGPLGDIPPRYDDAIRYEGLVSGNVARLETHPFRVQVSLMNQPEALLGKNAA